MLFQHHIRHIQKIYNACKDSLGTEEDERRREFKRIVSAYYPNLTVQDRGKAWALMQTHENERVRRRRSRDMRDTYSQRLGKVFQRLDLDGNGSIDEEELRYALGNDPWEKAFVATVLEYARNGSAVDMKEFLEFASHHQDLYTHLEQITQRMERHANIMENASMSAAIFRHSVNDVRARRPSLEDVL